MKNKRGWMEIIEDFTVEYLLLNGFPLKQTIEFAEYFILDRQREGVTYNTFDFCMGVWCGWRETPQKIKKTAWKTAISNLIKEGCHVEKHIRNQRKI